MKQIGPGILSKSEIYFSSSSLKAKKLYYNVLCAGHFYCDGNYHLKRDNYDSILVLHIIDGTFTFKNENSEFITVEKNNTVILDCYESHEYFANDLLEFLWIHIDGVNSREICREIINCDGNISKSVNQGLLKDLIFKIFDDVKSGALISEHQLSFSIYELLLELLNPSKPKDKTIHEENITRAKEYIGSHLNEQITVDILSDVANMSVTNFSRIFRQQTGFSPYDYVLSTRLNKAKEYLLKTNMSVTQIAYETGFNSESNFIYCFTNNEGISPGKFRKLKF